MTLSPSRLRRQPVRILAMVLLVAAGACGTGTDGPAPVDVPVDASGDAPPDTPTPDLIPDTPADTPPDTSPPDVDEELPRELPAELPEDASPCPGGCDDGDPCTQDDCVSDVGCVSTPIEGCCPGQFPLEIGFEGEDPLAGGAVEELVAPYPDATGLPGLGWQVVEGFAWSGSGSLYFGDPAMKTYHNDHRVAATYATPSVTLAEARAHALTFQAWIDVEEGVWSDYLVVFARVEGQDIPLWSKDDFNVTMGKWNEITVDLTAFAGRTLALVFLFDSHDEKENFGKGIYLDDLQVEMACEPLVCDGLADCYTLSPCLEGSCQDGQCVYTWNAACCLTPAECEDWDGCTLEFCDDHECYAQADPDPSCCNGNGECADDDPVCTTDVCKNNTCTYLPTGAAGCCVLDLDCDDTDPCTKDLCKEQACVHVNLCCATDADCDDGDDLCTTDQCIGGACYFVASGADGCCVEKLVDETFEDDQAQGFVLETTSPGLGWQVQAGDSYGGGKALIIDADEPAQAFTATATVNVGAIPSMGAELMFAVKLTLADSGDCQENRFRVLVGSEEVYTGCVSLPGYLPVTLDLGDFAGQTVPIEFELQVNPGGDGSYWAGIDSVKLLQDCCSADADCEDGNPCTADLCPGTNTTCQFPAIPGCCLASSECGDGDVCTQDVCTSAHVCEHYNLCCETDGECDDGDEICTDDLCINSFCQYIPTGASGCCTPVTSLETFEDGVDDWTLTGGVGDFGWKASQAQAYGGDTSLAYTNSAGTGYEDDAFGTATSPEMDLPDQSGVSVVFQLWYEMEGCCDDLDLYLVAGDGETLLGNWAGTDGTSWQEVSLDVSAWAGETVRFRFEFSSDGSVSYAGAFIDDFSIRQECCQEDSDCDDGDPCTTDYCPGLDSLCAFVPQVGCCTEDEACGDGDPCTLDTCTSSNGGVCKNTWICCETDGDCDDGEDVCTDDVCVAGFCQFLFTGAAGCCEPLLWSEGFEGGSAGWTFVNQSATPSWHVSTAKASAGGAALAFSDGAGGSSGTSQDSSALSPPLTLGVQPGTELSLQVWYDTESGFDWCKLWVDAEGGSTLLEQFTGHEGTTWTPRIYPLDVWAGQEISLRFEWHCDGSVSYPGIWFDELAITQGCCNADADCDDGDACTLDDCPGLQSMCNNPPIQGCCNKSKDCDDGDPCTDDLCSGEGGTCAHINVCCTLDLDCDDGDDVCTQDICVGGSCAFVPSGASGCCTPVLFKEGFEDTLAGWTVNNSSTTYGWKLSTAKASSGAKSLAYTDAVGGSYGTSNNGSILSPLLELPDQPGLSVGFMLWYELEGCCDDLNVSVVHGGGTTLLANYAGTDAASWQEVSFDVDAYKGQSIRVLFEFSCDGSVSYDGVFIDDLSITQDCCSSDAECDDGNPCTEDSCPGVESLCVFLPKADCCLTDADCADAEACTVDDCPAAGASCVNQWVCCAVDGDCDDGDDLCTSDSCAGATCQFVPTGAPGCCSPEVWAETFETGGGWTFTGGDTTYFWHVGTSKPHDGTKSLHYGNLTGSSYGNSQDGTALSPPIPLGSKTNQSLKLWVWYDTEANLDWCRLFVVHSGGETQLAEYTGHGQAFWEQLTYPVGAWASQTVRLKLQFHTDGSVTYPGVWVDGITITQVCCAGNADCNDQDPCTTDACTAGVCTFTPVGGCCSTDEECDDSDPCTEDTCFQGACDYATIC
ncbi:MAG: immune inhibitor A [Deltaproteobacteria bacterium]|nr:immune inhibitor A [Deltaproteobacteria bacterium]